jgi:membrane fusion protein (multidrug efflux system)
MRYAKLLSLLIVCSLLINSCKSKKKDIAPKERPAIVVDVIVAGNDNVKSTLEVNGSVLSTESVELRTETSGRLIYLNIPDGAKVSKGTVLARVNDAELQAQLEQQKSALDLAQKTEKRLANLLKINGVNQADYDVALNQLNTIQANIKVTTALIEKTVIKAPFSGELGLRLVSQGAYVTPTTLIGTLQQTDKVKIDFSVPETYSDVIKKGDLIKVISSNSTEPFEASIHAIEPQVNTVSRNIKVRAYLTSGLILPGSFVKVIMEQERQSIMVPSNAIIPDALSNQVVVVHKNKAIYTSVETGIRNASQVELVKGINIGDSIVVSGMLSMRPNTMVNVKKVKKLNEN